MKRLIVCTSIFSAALIVVLVTGAGILLVQQAARLHPVVGWLVGLVLVVFMLIGLLAAALLMISLLGRFTSLTADTPRHRRYLKRLAGRHRRYPVTAHTNLPTEPADFVNALYQQLDHQAEIVITTGAETIFFHTAISQAGSMDLLVVLGAQLKLVRRLAGLYYPRLGLRVLLPLYLAVGRAALLPGGRAQVNLGDQIGPAIVGASVVGAIPGANLVSMIIADAVIQGSANALALFRTGLLTRRYFHSRLQVSPFQPEIERQQVSDEAMSLLAALVPGASGVLSREIWDAAKDNLRRMPAATYDSLKSLISRSVRGLARKKGDQGESSDENVT